MSSPAPERSVPSDVTGRRRPLVRTVDRALAFVVLLFVTIGCAETDQEIYVAGEPGLATFTNTLKEPVYLPGCAPFVTERSLDGEWIDQGPPFVCIWEGIAVEVGPSEAVETPFDAPTESGVYRIRYGVSARCEPGLPLSQANCQLEDMPRTAAFTVERELCDPSDRGCRFVPAAPNFLCEDGVNFGGPAAECTRDPISGACGYEFLSCP